MSLKRSFNNLSVNWKTYYRKKNYTQCYRCQGFGHSGSNAITTLNILNRLYQATKRVHSRTKFSTEKPVATLSWCILRISANPPFISKHSKNRQNPQKPITILTPQKPKKYSRTSHT